MDLLGNLALGFQVAMSLENLFYSFIGCMVGTMIGVLPGIGPIAALAMLLPTTFYLPPTGALIMLAGIYYGAQYGGSTTSILVNIPGESSSIVTCIDGYQMARTGRAGAALATAALSSFFAGTVCTLLIAVAAPPLSQVALSFGAAEYFALMVLGLTGSIVLAHGSVLNAVGMVLLGLLFGLVGTDVNSGTVRYTFGLPVLSDGLGFVPIALGMLGVAEIISNLEARTSRAGTGIAQITRLWLTLREFKQAWPAAIRGTGIGAALGVLPGGGALLASFASYTVEKKIADDPSRFGKGAIEGVAGPEAANNAGAQTSFIPMLTLGIPSNAIMAIMIGAMTIQGIAPGPRVMTNQPELFWGIIASMWVGNAMLVVLNLPLIGMWVKLLKIPYRMLFPSIVLICAIGGFSLNNSTYEIGMVGVFGFLGYFLRKVGCEPAPLALGFILGPLMEENLRRAMLLSRGDPLVFVQRPISLTLLCVAAALILMIVLPNLRKTRAVAFQDD
jgi:putative tricarboxylic transport membrane protein